MSFRNVTGTLCSTQRQAFTLLEIVVAIGLAILLLSLTVPTLSTSIREESLRKPAREIQSLFRTGRQDSIRLQKTHAVRLVRDKKTTTLGLISGNEAHHEKPSFIETVRIHSSLRLLHKTRQTEKWREDYSYQWYLQPTGLMEPVQYRIENERDWLEFEFHPLTGNIIEERFHFP